MKQNAGWADGPWVGFDTETTGVSPHHDRLVTAAVVTREAGVGPRTSDRVRTWLVNPGIEIPAGASQIHGITTAHARTYGQDPRDALEGVNTALADHLRTGEVMVVFNAGFDLPLLEADSIRHGVEPLKARLNASVAPVVDPLVLDRALNRYRRGKRTLSDLATAYGIPLPTDTHKAEVDAELALDLLAAMVEKYPQLREMSADELHSFQTHQHAIWAENFQAFLRRQGRDTTISTRWF